MEAIILAGGYGKRLKHFTEKIPKPLLLVNGIPFLTYIFELLLKYNVKRVVLSVFYKKDSIYGFYGNKYKKMYSARCTSVTVIASCSRISMRFSIFEFRTLFRALLAATGSISMPTPLTFLYF